MPRPAVHYIWASQADQLEDERDSFGSHREYSPRKSSKEGKSISCWPNTTPKRSSSVLALNTNNCLSTRLYRDLRLMRWRSFFVIGRFAPEKIIELMKSRHIGSLNRLAR